ncbi:MAG: cation transporter [Atopobiaceae bacterium]|nr:cation transporter [Atopobiaceae bacterium]
MRWVLWLVLILNLLVAVAKFAYGTFTRSVSMRADGIASMFDTVSNLVGILGMMLAARPADANHPYGHAKFETYASAVIGFMLLMAAFNVGRDAYVALASGVSDMRVDVGSYVVMLATLAINICVSHYERWEGARLRSEVLSADALHTMSDALVSVSVVVALILVQLGFTRADALCSCVVAVAILKSAFEVLRQVNKTLSDEARIDPAEVKALVLEVPCVRDCHRIRTRGTEAEVYLDLHVLVDPSMPILQAHEVGERVERALAANYPEVVEVMVHLEPDTDEERSET